MTTNGVEANHRPPVPCPHKTIPLITVGGQADARTPEQIRMSEEAILDRARIQANSVLVAANPAIRKLTRPVARSFRKTEAALERLRRFTLIGSTAQALEDRRKVRDRHANDGAEDRRRRPAWTLWVLWPAIVCNSLFEAIYLGENFRELLDVDEDMANPLYWAAYLPAVGLMVALMQAGTMIAQALFRRRDRTERREVLPKLFGPKMTLPRMVLPQHRKPDDLPWSSWGLPIAFTMALFTMLSAWALIRAYLATADGGRLQSYEYFAAGTLVLLAASVVVLKIITYNSYADSAAEATKLLKVAEKQSALLPEKAHERTTRHLDSWTSLNTALSAAENRAQSVIDEAANQVRSLRAESPQPPVGEIVKPELDSTILQYAHDVLARYDPGLLDAKLAKRTKALAEQFGSLQP